MAIPTVHRLDPAFSVLQRLGGKNAVAAELNLSSSTLSRWCSPRPKGTGGAIPQRYWPQLLALAKKGNVSLVVGDLYLLRNEE